MAEIPSTDLDSGIVIRQYRAEDAEQVHAILVEGLVYGAGSPRNTALRKALYRPVSFAAVASLIIGLVCLAQIADPAPRLLGAALCLGVAATFAVIHLAITQFFLRLCTIARATDMRNIPAAYDIPQPGAPNGGFWVAALDYGHDKRSEVVGYIGLKCESPASGTLRRMFVAVQHRRRGIGSMLLTAAMAHALRISLGSSSSRRLSSSLLLYSCMSGTGSRSRARG
ncbi:hypothetical protein B0H17DRAFT_224054 [Mycena rosella]|uniref:N-acetyltransferase domain-containing protein n=1 Tax=Mycena rosella TaxID=1033263 RepID=A0AAD7CXK2_MYCRO|nr:hypothetical protein B0H17DRAFT_224054 [Mycena rosella]